MIIDRLIIIMLLLLYLLSQMQDVHFYHQSLFAASSRNLQRNFPANLIAATWKAPARRLADFGGCWPRDLTVIWHASGVYGRRVNRRLYDQFHVLVNILEICA